MLKLKLQYFGHLMWRVDSLEKTLMLGGIGGRGRRGQQRVRWLDSIRLDGRESEWTPGVGDGQGGLACCDSWGSEESDTTERLNWIDTHSFLRSEKGLFNIVSSYLTCNTSNSVNFKIVFVPIDDISWNLMVMGWRPLIGLMERMNLVCYTNACLKEASICRGPHCSPRKPVY